MKPEYSRITLRHILAFLEVAKCNSFTLAAKSLNITQPALTATIKQFEDSLGVRLFDRTTRAVLLTSDGADLFPMAKNLAHSFSETIDDFRAIAERKKGNVSISSLLSFAVNILPKAIRLFSDKYPQIRLSIRDENSAAVTVRVKQREVDFGISSPPDASKELNFKKLFSEPFGVVCRSDWFEGYEKVIDWEALSQHNYIGFASETGIYSKIMETPNLPENIRSPRYSIATISAFEGFLNEGLGFSILPRLGFPTKSIHKIKFLKIIKPSISREVGLITCANHALSIAARAMYTLISENCSKFMPSDLE